MHKPTSDCCNALIIESTSEFDGDKCDACKIGVRYALVGYWAKKFGESFAVCELYNGEQFFYWLNVSKWHEVQKHLEVCISRILHEEKLCSS